MMTFEEQINQSMEDPFVRIVETMDVDSLDYGYTRAQAVDLLKRVITDPVNQPRWIENDFQAYWERPINGHHFVAYHILQGKAWDHGLATPSPVLMNTYSPMGSLANQAALTLSMIIAEDIMKQQAGVDNIPRIATTPESIHIRKNHWKVTREATKRCEVVAWVISKIPDERGQHHLGLIHNN